MRSFAHLRNSLRFSPSSEDLACAIKAGNRWCKKIVVQRGREELPLVVHADTIQVQHLEIMELVRHQLLDALPARGCRTPLRHKSIHDGFETLEMGIATVLPQDLAKKLREVLLR